MADRERYLHAIPTGTLLAMLRVVARCALPHHGSPSMTATTPPGRSTRWASLRTPHVAEAGSSCSRYDPVTRSRQLSGIGRDSALACIYSMEAADEVASACLHIARQAGGPSHNEAAHGTLCLLPAGPQSTLSNPKVATHSTNFSESERGFTAGPCRGMQCMVNCWDQATPSSD